MAIVFLGADHRGFQLKEKIKEWLTLYEYEFNDLGDSKYDPGDDFVDYAIKVSEKVILEKSKGILICGSGVGMSIAANKVRGARAALCTNQKQARLAREEDDANILCLSSEQVDEESNKDIVLAFLGSVFAGDDKYFRRLNKIKTYESQTN